MKKKESLIFGRQFVCTDCAFKDRPIIIVGPNHFSTDLLANYIRANKPAQISAVSRLVEVPHPDGLPKAEWRLIFVDCLNQNANTIRKMLQTEGASYVQHDIIALFNLSPGTADISIFIDLGVRGFFFDTDEPDVLLKGICALKYGEMWISRGVLMEYISRYPRQNSSIDKVAGRLTPREKDILVELSNGATGEEIASRLFISLHTVKTHITHICKKLDVHNRMQAALWAVKYLR
ncbi:MAG: response regulator transcription factor [Desulfobulbaceae bacterium]|nr:response regulator transcription factor [Desulfobulbaceae bacterium]